MTALRPQSFPPTFWQLPGRVRAQIYSHACSRSFSSSRRTQSSTTDAVTTTIDTGFSALTFLTTPPLLLLDGLHNLGMPWWAVIPASAVLVQGASAYYAGGGAHRKAKLSRAVGPLVQATALVAGRDVGKDEVEYWRVRHRARREVEKRFETKWTPTRQLVNLLLMLCMSEAVRMKTGARDGLLSIMSSWSSTIWSGNTSFWRDINHGKSTSTVVEAPWSPTAVDSPFSSTASEFPFESTVVESPVTSLDELLQPHEKTIQEIAAYDPSTTLEGFRFCIDLTAPDPTNILPLTLLVTTLYGIICRPYRARAATGYEWVQTFGFFDGVRAVLAGVVFWYVQLAAGAYLYIVCDRIVLRLTQFAFNFSDPIPPPIMPCTNKSLRRDAKR